MKYILYSTLLGLFCACGQNSNSPEKLAGSDTVMAKVNKEKIFDYPVLYKNWQIGDHNNTRLVLQMYKAWDSASVGEIKQLLADSVTLDLPDGRTYSAPKDEMVAALVNRRKIYLYAANEILAAYPLINTDNNDQWVSALVYNKWMYKDRKRDSMLYQDLWKIKDGKISSLLSLQQTPSRLGIKKLEQLIKLK